MKKLAVLFLFALTLGIFAQDANLLKNASWRLYSQADKTSVIDRQNGTFSFVGTAEFKKAGVIQIVVLNQTEPKAITFTAESKCEDVKGNTANNYVIYLDILHTDNTYTFGVQANFKNGTHDWEKVQYTYTPKKTDQNRQLLCIVPQCRRQSTVPQYHSDPGKIILFQKNSKRNVPLDSAERSVFYSVYPFCNTSRSGKISFPYFSCAENNFNSARKLHFQ